MIRKFLECRSIEERMKFLADTTISDWTEQELDTVINTMGIQEDGLTDKTAKLAAIGKHLSDFRHEVEEKTEMDCHELDEENFQDEGETLYEPESVLESVTAALEDV